MNGKYQALVAKAIALGALEAKLTETDQIVFDLRSHLKCRFGCNRWGKYWTCPPHTGLSQEMFMEAFKKYKKALVIKTSNPKIGQDLSLTIEKSLEAARKPGPGRPRPLTPTRSSRAASRRCRRRRGSPRALR